METANVTVSTTATRLDRPGVSGAEVILLRDASGAMFIGGSDVTTGNGWPYSDTDDPIAVPIEEDGLWGIVAAGTETVRVMRTS